jgi:hypothetical protein
MPKKNIKDKKDKINKVIKKFKNKIAIKINIDNSKKTHKNLRKKADDQAKQQPFIFNSSVTTRHLTHYFKIPLHLIHYKIPIYMYQRRMHIYQNQIL